MNKLINLPGTYIYQYKLNYKVVAFLVSVLSLTYACDRRNEATDNSLDEIQFEVTDTLLGSMITNDDNMFEFSVPKLLSVPESNFMELEDQLNSNLADDINISLLYVWTDSVKENSLSVSKIILTDDFLSDPIDYYSGIIGNTDLFKIASKAKFLKDGVLISQFITKHNNHIIIKIIFQPKADYLIQFDYIFNEKNYKQEVRSIESSIGSIKIL
jgi:hypothetical protein